MPTAEGPPPQFARWRAFVVGRLSRVELVEFVGAVERVGGELAKRGGVEVGRRTGGRHR
ncbi:hypothetical protein [Mycobacterium sp.]|uniref:hypothetical protein n=1 Tax=Mycobacterium sp. TaxID=1785 RepID=UPI0033402549